MNMAPQETKKPTCVGFFVEQNLLSVLLQARQLEQQQAPQQVPLQQQVQQEPQRVPLRQQVPGQLQELEQVQQPEQGREPVHVPRFCHRRLRTGPTTQQPEQSISFIFPSLNLMTTQKNQIIQSAIDGTIAKDAAFYQLSGKIPDFLGVIAPRWSLRAPGGTRPTFQ